MLNEILFDARELEAPEPLTGAVRLAKKLNENEYVKMIHRMKPCHLFDMLSKQNIWSCDFEYENSHIIFMAKDANAVAYIKEKVANEYGRTVA